MFKGLFTNFEYITFMSCLNQRNIFLLKVHLDKTTLIKMIEKMVLKVSSCYMYNITILGRTDFEHPIFSIISSHSCFIEMDLS